MAELPTGTGGGMIGVTFAPGKERAHGLTGPHDRDLGADLDAVAAWGAAAVVTLMAADELARCRIPGIGDEIRGRFMGWQHLPVRDIEIPDASFEAAWPRRSTRLRAPVAAGNRVLVHCRGGLGRAGMVAAGLLVEMGTGPEAAIAMVRRARDPRAVGTRAQEAGAAGPPAGHRPSRRGRRQGPRHRRPARSGVFDPGF